MATNAQIAHAIALLRDNGYVVGKLASFSERSKPGRYENVCGCCQRNFLGDKSDRTCASCDKMTWPSRAARDRIQVASDLDSIERDMASLAQQAEEEQAAAQEDMRERGLMLMAQADAVLSIFKLAKSKRANEQNR
jgi:hypothetical protein